jgi:hypothetical protein
MENQQQQQKYQVLPQEDFNQVDENNLEDVTGGGWLSRIFKRKQYEDPYAELYYHNKEQGLNQNAPITRK